MTAGRGRKDGKLRGTDEKLKKPIFATFPQANSPDQGSRISFSKQFS